MQDLPFHTLTQFVALGITLIAGWFLGLATSSGGRKWRDRYSELELDHAGYRDRAEADLQDATRRIRDLEAQNAQLRTAAPVLASASAPVDHGQSTAALAGAAIAGAAAGAIAANASEHHPAPVHAAPIVEPPAHAEHAPDAPAPIAHDSHGDDHHAPAESHH